MAITTHSDGGYKSRKWVGFLISLAAVMISGKIMSPETVANVVIGIGTIFGIFCGANVWRDQAAFKNGVQIEPPTSIKAVIADAKALAAQAKAAPAPSDEEGS